MIKIQRSHHDEPLELPKRTYVPYVLTSTCPTCGAEVDRDLSCDYLGAPLTNTPEDVFFHHVVGEGDEEEEHVWTEEGAITLTIVVTAVAVTPVG